LSCAKNRFPLPYRAVEINQTDGVGFAMEDRLQTILVEMQRLIEESRRLRQHHDQLTVEYEKLKREFDRLIRQRDLKVAGRARG
jgi:hypothetical protein